MVQIVAGSDDFTTPDFLLMLSALGELSIALAAPATDSIRIVAAVTVVFLFKRDVFIFISFICFSFDGMNYCLKLRIGDRTMEILFHDFYTTLFVTV